MHLLALEVEVETFLESLKADLTGREKSEKKKKKAKKLSFPRIFASFILVPPPRSEMSSAILTDGRPKKSFIGRFAP